MTCLCLIWSPSPSPSPSPSIPQPIPIPYPTSLSPRTPRSPFPSSLSHPGSSHQQQVQAAPTAELIYSSARAVRYSFVSSADLTPGLGLHPSSTATRNQSAAQPWFVPPALLPQEQERNSLTACQEPKQNPANTLPRNKPRPLPTPTYLTYYILHTSLHLPTPRFPPSPLSPIPLIHIPGPAADAVSCIIRSARPLALPPTAPLPIALGAPFAFLD